MYVHIYIYFCFWIFDEAASKKAPLLFTLVGNRYGNNGMLNYENVAFVISRSFHI